ncbi:unnamed protein product [Periconia digitata]|uniref:C3H1-type domain-containing protein n=1 Tax=Periconia digitata TaxID=1303443 RepID=A0A9W4U7W4_9PLEO|nr:unnamed protein product [Periconia digitata]
MPSTPDLMEQDPASLLRFRRPSSDDSRGSSEATRSPAPPVIVVDSAPERDSTPPVPKSPPASPGPPSPRSLTVDEETKNHKERWVREWPSEAHALRDMEYICLRDILGQIHDCKRGRNCPAVFHICRDWFWRKGEKTCNHKFRMHLDAEENLVVHVPTFCTSLLRNGKCQRGEGQCQYVHIGEDMVRRRLAEKNKAREAEARAWEEEREKNRH